MTSAIADTITLLEHELEAIDQRRGEIARAIETLRPLAGDRAPATNGKRPRTTDGRTDGRSKTRAAHPDDEVGPQETGRRQKIQTALSAGPLATRELAALIKVDRMLTKMTLQRMAKVGLIAGIGVGPARRWTLPGKSAKEAP